ncbi:MULTISPECIES: DUF6932 family protein [Tsukamurella]|uniref:Uncharacterized protein n=2 Tax=Tsukamurella TaxID=2060 RepID=A0A5C5RX41_9ACTN|nr:MULTISPECIES: hypothetical protein [Tsukamurella]NMD55572.1 hypothetical protein [Tsukamurella columbiensis]TWS27322.1 hypothetical protein FK530_19455 [Tsukamurella conjunctivitidis]
MIPALEANGWLPRGRFCAGLDEVEERFVLSGEFGDSARRPEVWEDFKSLLALIADLKAKVPAVFLGGSFVTDAMEPSDVDAAIIVDTSRIRRPETLQRVANTIAGAKRAGLAVDGFMIPWHPDGTQYGQEPAYVELRGVWDDFWQRYVPKPDRNPPQRHHAMPLRGYLEVTVDGYR